MNSDYLFDGGCATFPAVVEQADTPERRLLRALLTDAIELATGMKPVKDGEQAQARQWLGSKNDDWIIPCSLVCAFLGIDQGAMLREIKPKFGVVLLPPPARS